MSGKGPGKGLASRLRAAPLAAVVLAALLSPACAQEAPDAAAAVAVGSGAFGALMVGSRGEMLLPAVSRDDLGRVTGVTGALWMDPEGSTVAVFLDPATGLPVRTVFGDYELIFTNWSPDRSTADIARIFGPTGYVEVYRNVPMVVDGGSASAGVVASAATCLPNCPTKLQTVSETLKLAGVALSAGACYAAAGISFGAMLLPCTGYLVGAAKTVIGNEAWLNDLDGVNRYLTGIDVVQCVAGMDAGSCVSAALEGATTAMDRIGAVITGNAALEDTAGASLADDNFSGGGVQGIPPACDKVYNCTPGLTLNCVQGGQKTCREDCTWGDCPSSKPTGDCSVGADGDSVCAALVADVQSQCAAKGGRIVAWSPDLAACVKAYACWTRGCPCVLSCGARCGNDPDCTRQCVAGAGGNLQAEAAACAACAVPEVKGQCQTGG